MHVVTLLLVVLLRRSTTTLGVIFFASSGLLCYGAVAPTNFDTTYSYTPQLTACTQLKTALLWMPAAARPRTRMPPCRAAPASSQHLLACTLQCGVHANQPPPLSQSERIGSPPTAPLLPLQCASCFSARRSTAWPPRTGSPLPASPILTSMACFGPPSSQRPSCSSCSSYWWVCGSDGSGAAQQPAQLAHLPARSP